MNESADAETPQPGTAEAEATPEVETAREPGRPAGRVAGWLASDRVARGGLVVGLVAVVAAATALVGVVRHDDRPRAAVGDIIDVAFQEGELPRRAEVLLPWTRLDVAAGDVRAELPDLLGAPPNLRAPAGGRFVRVQVELAEDGLVPLAAVDAPFTEETEVALRADGREYPLTGQGGLVLGPSEPAYGQGGEVWVAVDGDPRELEVLVTIDGVTQVVDAADGTVATGRAAGLSDLPTPQELQDAEPVRCTDPERLDDSDLRFAYPDPPLPCRVQLSLRTPFVDGLGWAEPGREFLVVHVVGPDEYVDVSRRGSTEELWDLEGLTLDGRIGGEPALARSKVNDLGQGALAISDPDDPDQLVFDVPVGGPVGDLDVTATLRVSLGDPFVTDREAVRLRWTVPGEVLA